MKFLSQASCLNGQAWKAILLLSLEKGINVDVTAPKHDDSPHNCGFNGTVNEVKDDCVCVKDMDENVWDIELDEIEDWEGVAKNG